MLTKDQILSITDKAIREVEVPEWDGTVFIRGATMEDIDYYQRLEDKNDDKALQKMIVRIVCDADGNPLFTEKDIPKMQKKSLQAFKRIVKEFKAFNSLEDAEKNS